MSIKINKLANYQKYLLITGILLSSWLSNQPLQAQITPDTTLPINSTVTNNGNSFLLNGGTKNGTNLFHSFKDFSIPTGNTAVFNNALDVQNIITRVTGSSISNIDGVIKANGTANLFLINPNGLIFGQNAALNIGGSFLGTTANSIKFADGIEFSANPTATPLLSINVPIGLILGNNPGEIRVQGTGNKLNKSTFFSPFVEGISASSIRVGADNTLGLVGGNITLEGGTLTAQAGRIELGSVESGIVNINLAPRGFTLNYQGVQNFRDIRLTQQALADASGNSGGSIQVQGRYISLRDGSLIFIQNQGLKTGGNIEVNAENLELIGTSPDARVRSSLVSEIAGKGDGGKIRVTTKNLLIRDGAEINTRTQGEGKAGIVDVYASESIQLIGASVIKPSFLTNISTTTFTGAKAENTIVVTPKLSVLDGAVIASLTFGQGKSGDVIINAPNSIEVSGAEPIFLGASSLSSSSLGLGNAGDLTVNTGKLIIRNSGRVDASTFVSGASGSATINASESIEVSGRYPGATNPSAIIASANILDEGSRKAFGLPDVPSGNSGNVTINTPRLNVFNEGQVTVKNDGTGNAGKLTVNSNSIFLNTKGNITAATTSGEGGNISLKADNILLRNKSAITGTAGGSGNGGNLNINTNTLVLLENSAITADAFRGRGGNIEIVTQGLFKSSDSSITASSQFGINGVVEIKTPDIDPSKGLVNLNQQIVDASSLMANTCDKLKNSSFYVIGKGGFPTIPTDTLFINSVLPDLGNSENYRSKNETEKPSKAQQIENNSSHAKLIEASGWQIDNKGQIILTANVPTTTPHALWQKSASCR